MPSITIKLNCKNHDIEYSEKFDQQNDEKFTMSNLMKN